MKWRRDETRKLTKIRGCRGTRGLSLRTDLRQTPGGSQWPCKKCHHSHFTDDKTEPLASADSEEGADPGAKPSLLAPEQLPGHT